MKFPILTSLIVFIVWLTVKLSQSKSDRKEKMDAYWEKELAANTVRKKSLDDLDYIQFPFHLLPSEASFTDEGRNIPSSLLMLEGLKDKKIVNLNNISNTDLKLQYGTTNITILSEYDENYITLCREGFLLSEYLYDNDRFSEAEILAKALIDAGSDVSNQFTLLARLYLKAGQPDRLEQLKEQVRSMTSSRKDAILRALQEVEDSASSVSKAAPMADGSAAPASAETKGDVEDIPLEQ